MSSAWPARFEVRLNRHTRTLEGGHVLIGGSPTRVSRLTPTAADAVTDRRILVRDPPSRALALHLIEAGLADPLPETLPLIPLSELTVVVPVHDRPAQLRRLLASIPTGVAEVIVVDDASSDPAGIAAATAAYSARHLRLPVNSGPAAARNAGLAQTTTPFIAFVDSDVVLEEGCLTTLLRHFADPELAIAAPRVLGLSSQRENWITQYENARSSLDLGTDSALVRPRSRVSWVSSTCLVARIAHLGEGFDATMRVGEDVDLVWRLTRKRLRVRFEPAATVRHEHRTQPAKWLGRKFFYGTGAQLLGKRHPGDIAPVVLPPWGYAVLGALLAQRRWSLPVMTTVLAFATARIATRLTHIRRPLRVSAGLAARGLMMILEQGIALLLRHWWPLTLFGAVFSRRMRRAALLAAAVDTTIEFIRLRPRLGVLRFASARRLDDLAYGAGVWWGALRGRSLRALLPSSANRPRDISSRR